MIYKGRVWKFGDKISTDLMMPGFAVLTKPGISDEAAAKFCMIANRPGWAQQVQKGDIIVAGQNFGCGSSRPGQRMLRALGIPVVVAESTSRLFFRNSHPHCLPCPPVSRGEPGIRGGGQSRSGPGDGRGKEPDQGYIPLWGGVAQGQPSRPDSQGRRLGTFPEGSAGKDKSRRSQ